MAELPECVPGKGKESRLSPVCGVKQFASPIPLGLTSALEGDTILAQFYSYENGDMLRFRIWYHHHRQVAELGSGPRSPSLMFFPPSSATYHRMTSSSSLTRAQTQDAAALH